MTDLATMTPPEIDLILAGLWETEAHLRKRCEWTADAVHRAVGDQRVGGQYSRGLWLMTLNEAIDATPPGEYPQRSHAKAVADYTEAKMALIANLAEQLPYNNEYMDRQWSRFFLVKNANGHIHSSMDCSTCYITTRFGWLPQLSGLTEADAVKDQGEILCSVCFPTAPSAWTDGVSRATQEERAARAAAKEAREAKKLAKALLPDGTELVVKIGGYTERIGTLVTAKRVLTDTFEWNRDTEARQVIAEAIAAKTGETVDQVLEAARKRADKRKG